MSMLWKKAVAVWLAEMRRTRRDSTADGYAGALRVRELKPYRNLMVRDVTRESMAAAVKAIAVRGKERQAETAAAAIRGLFGSFGSDAMRSTSRVVEGVMEKLKSLKRSLDEPDDDDDDESLAGSPTRRHKHGSYCGWTMKRPRTNAIVSPGNHWSIRPSSGAGSRARVADFEPAREFGGLWRLPAFHHKTASVRRFKGRVVGAHVVPLPPSGLGDRPEHDGDRRRIGVSVPGGAGAAQGRPGAR
jgi:hypothetical protein